LLFGLERAITQAPSVPKPFHDAVSVTEIVHGKPIVTAGTSALIMYAHTAHNPAALFEINWIISAPAKSAKSRE
jgi:hypothetical protein